MMDFAEIEKLLAEHKATQRSLRDGNSKTPKELGTYDTETDGFHHCEDLACPKCLGLGRVPKPFLHGFYFGDTEEYVEFETVEEVVAFVEQRRALFYAHNGGKFDYHPLRPYMNTDEPVMLINGRIAKFRIGESEFRDSLNIFPNTKLADFGVKNEIDYELMEPANRVIPAVRREISLYMRQDCKGLWEQVDRYRREYGKSLTQAGASMKDWETRFHQAKAPRQTKTQFEQCNPFYYGGRVQCFEFGVQQTDFEMADKNSAYPEGMLHKHPISPCPTESKRLPRGEDYLRTSLIRLRCTARGCFPWRDPETRELYFPEDEALHARPRMREYCITGWEFLAALECNAVTNIQIKEVLSFDKLIDFDGYIQHHYQARMAADARGDKAGKIFGKFFMCGLYGKFGADPSNYAEYVIATTDTFRKWYAKGYREYQEWGEGKFLMEREPSEADLNDLTSRWRFYNVATAASITGYVRAEMFKAITKCAGMIYCDTDSVAARGVGQLSFGKELGYWKHEGKFDRYAIAGKKLYAFHQAGRSELYDPSEKDPNWKVASKGVAFHAMADGPQKIIDLAQGYCVRHIPQSPTYSVTRAEPVFIKRTIRRTAKDIRHVPTETGTAAGCLQ
jgi:hypothetical protein